MGATPTCYSANCRGSPSPADPPVLLEEPGEVVLPHPGVLARFPLSLSGHPWPEVVWSHISPTGEEQPLLETGENSR